MPCGCAKRDAKTVLLPIQPVIPIHKDLGPTVIFLMLKFIKIGPKSV